MTRVALVLAVTAAACSSLDAIEPGVCGNGVVEDGEDCDSDNGACFACGIVCGDGCTIPGYACGADGLCHAPSGAFRPVAAVPQPTASYRIVDVDHDGVGDVVSQSQTAVTVLFGSFDSDLSTTESILTPIAQGPASYADIDADGAADLLLPTADGVVAYTSAFGLPAPFPFPSNVGAMGIPAFAHVVDFGYIGFVGTAANGTFGYQVLNVGPNPPIAFGPVSLCGGALADFDPTTTDVFFVSPGHTLLSTTLAAGSATPTLCVIAADRLADGSITFRAVTPALAHPPQGRAVLASLRGPGCPSLVLRERVTGDLAEYHPTGTPGSCGFLAGPTLLTTAATGGEPVGWMPLAPASNGMTTALVLQSGIYGFSGGALVQLYTADRPLASIAFADFDDNNTVDLIASAVAADDLDIIYRNGPAFVRFRLDTDAPIRQFLLGDYDGNGRLDIAYVQSLLAADELAVSYNTGDQPLAGVLAGRFKRVLSVIPGSIPDSNDPGSVVDDLAILADGPDGPQVALLHGSPQRTMLAFFDPRPDGAPGPVTRTSVFRGVAAGNFVDSPGGVDLIAMDDVDVEGQVAITHHTEFWLSDGARGGAVDGLEPVYAPQVQRCDGGEAVDALCVADMSYVAWPAAADHDLVLGVDIRGHGGVADPRLVTRDPATDQLRVPIAMWPAGVVTVPAGSTVRGVRVLDVHGEQIAVVSFADSSGRSTGALRCHVDVASGIATSCDGFEADIANAVVGSWTCVDAAVAHVAPAARFSPPATDEADLIVLCQGPDRDAVFRIAADGFVTTLIDTKHGDQLQVGDVNGDAVDDIAIVDRGGAVSFLAVFVQCNSRDVASCQGGF